MDNAYTGCSLNVVFFLKMFRFFLTLPVLLQCWCLTCHCVHTDSVGKPRETRVRNIFKIFEKNTIFNEHPVVLMKYRIGIHSGNVVGGMVGTKIPHYSIFGDTVEIAGFMESRYVQRVQKQL